MSRACFFTGHRIVKVTDELTEHLKSTLIQLIDSGTVDFYAGGAINWDMLCENTVLQLKSQYPQIRLHLLLPCPPSEQTAKWNKAQQEEYDRILKAADSTETLSAAYHKDYMRQRNLRFVKSGDTCICYFNEKHRFGGTFQTVNMAREQGKNIYNLFEFPADP